ncbi:MAG: proton-conducting transporter membrane subunit [Clostridiaceae bacterium]
MDILSVGTLMKVSVLLFAFAAFMALILLKWHKICNITGNILCIIASLFGMTASFIHLLNGEEKITVAAYKTEIPILSFDMVLDRLSAFFILGLCVLVLCVSVYSIGYVSHYYGKRNVGLFNFLYSTFILSMFFVMTAGNTVFFFVAWEAMAMLSYYLVVFESEQVEKQKAGTLYIIMTHIGTAFLMIAFMLMYSYTKSFDMFGNTSAIPAAARNIMFILFLAGFGVKAGVIPVHIWLPYAHPAAPGNISALMSGIMIKTAVYGILRFVLTYLGVERTWWGAAILVIGMVSAVLGVAYAFVEKNIKRLLAYSSIENMGIIFMGMGVAFMAFSRENQAIGALALAASLFHTFNHTLFKGGLFLSAGSVHFSTHTLNMEHLGGLIKKMPVTAVFMLGGALSISAIVPFNGFASEWLTLQSLFCSIAPDQAAFNITAILSVAALAIAGALAAACFVKLFGISFLGLGRTEHALHAAEVPVIMNIGTGLLIVPCLIIGLFPMLFLRLTDNLVKELAGRSIVGKVSGPLLMADYTSQVSGNSISPFTILVVLVVLILSTLLVLRLVGGRYAERKYGTWDCGFEELNSRMQYSATGFSKPVEIVFRMLFRPSRKLKVEGDLPYHPETMEYSTTMESVFEKYIYTPVLRFIRNASKRIKFSVQTGSVHMYLIYIFITVLALMLYNRIA